MHAVAEPPFEAVAVEQCHEELKVLFLAVVRGRGEQQEVARQAAEQLPQPVALGVPDLSAGEGRRHLVRFVAYNQVPVAVGRLQLLLQRFVTRQLVEARDDQVGLQKPVAGARRGRLVVGEDLEVQVEALVQLVLPLFGQAAGAHHQAALQVAAGDQLLHQQAGHDRLASTGIVGQQKAQRLPRQHRFVHRGDLVRQRFHQRRVHRQRGVEQVREVDAQRLRYQPKQLAVAVEAPRPPLLDHLQARFVVAVEDLAAQLAARPAIGELKCVRPEPAHAHDGDQGIGQDAAHGGGGLQVLQLHTDDDNVPPRVRTRRLVASLVRESQPAGDASASVFVVFHVTE